MGEFPGYSVKALRAKRLIIFYDLKSNTLATSHLHVIEKKYGIRINLLRWSGDNYEAGTLNALIKIDSTKVGQILLNSIAYHVRHHPKNSPKNSLNGVLEIRPYGDGGCQALTSPADAFNPIARAATGWTGK